MSLQQKILLVAFVFLSMPLYSENTKNILELIKGKYDYLEVNTLIQGTGEDENTGSDISYQVYELMGNLRFDINEILTMDVGIYAAQYSFDLEDFGADLKAEIINLELGFHWTLGNFLISSTISPGIHSDFNDINSKHYNLSAIFEAGYSFNKNLAITIGAKVYQRDDSWEVLPLFGFYAKMGPIYFDILAPLRAEIGAKLCDKVTLYAKFDATIKEQVVIDDDTARYINYFASIGVKYHIATNVTFFAEGGVNIATEFQGDGNNASFNAEQEDGEFAMKIGIKVTWGQDNSRFDADPEAEDFLEDSDTDEDVIPDSADSIS